MRNYKVCTLNFTSYAGAVAGNLGQGGLAEDASHFPSYKQENFNT